MIDSMSFPFRFSLLRFLALYPSEFWLSWCPPFGTVVGEFEGKS